MDKYDENIYSDFIKTKIYDTNNSRMLYEQDKITDCKFKAFENDCVIRDVFDNYISNHCRTKNQSYVNLIQLIQKNFSKVKYRMTKDNVNSNRSVFMKTVKDFMRVYIYEPCDLAVQKKLHKRATDFIEKRENKRIKNN